MAVAMLVSIDFKALGRDVNPSSTLVFRMGSGSIGVEMMLPIFTTNTEATVAVLLRISNSKNTSRVLPGVESLGEAARFSQSWILWHRVAHFHEEVGNSPAQYQRVLLLTVGRGHGRV